MPGRTAPTAEFTDVPLFDAEPYRVAAPEPLTRGQRRAARIAALHAAGLHPLAGPLRTPIRLHPWAAPLADRAAPGLRCGGCAHRVLLRGDYSRAYPKCVADGGRRATHYDGTDCRRYWSACTDYRSKSGGRA